MSRHHGPVSSRDPGLRAGVGRVGTRDVERSRSLLRAAALEGQPLQGAAAGTRHPRTVSGRYRRVNTANGGAADDGGRPDINSGKLVPWYIYCV